MTEPVPIPPKIALQTILTLQEQYQKLSPSPVKRKNTNIFLKLGATQNLEFASERGIKAWFHRLTHRKEYNFVQNAQNLCALFTIVYNNAHTITGLDLEKIDQLRQFQDQFIALTTTKAGKKEAGKISELLNRREWNVVKETIKQFTNIKQQFTDLSKTIEEKKIQQGKILEIYIATLGDVTQKTLNTINTNTINTLYSKSPEMFQEHYSILAETLSTLSTLDEKSLTENIQTLQAALETELSTAKDPLLGAITELQNQLEVCISEQECVEKSPQEALTLSSDRFISIRKRFDHLQKHKDVPEFIELLTFRNEVNDFIARNPQQTLFLHEASSLQKDLQTSVLEFDLAASPALDGLQERFDTMLDKMDNSQQFVDKSALFQQRAECVDISEDIASYCSEISKKLQTYAELLSQGKSVETTELFNQDIALRNRLITKTTLNENEKVLFNELNNSILTYILQQGNIPNITRDITNAIFAIQLCVEKLQLEGATDAAHRLQEYSIDILLDIHVRKHSSQKANERLGTLLFLLDHDPTFTTAFISKEKSVLSQYIKERSQQILESSQQILNKNLETVRQDLKAQGIYAFSAQQRGVPAGPVQTGRKEIEVSTLIADCLVTSSGTCNTGIIPLLKKTFLPQNTRHLPFEKKILSVLKEFQHTEALKDILDTVTSPEPTNLAGDTAVRMLLSLPQDTPITHVHAKKAAVATLFSRSRQVAMSNCYATYFTIQTGINHTANQLDDISNIIHQGSLYRETKGIGKHYIADMTASSASSQLEIMITDSNKESIVSNLQLQEAVRMMGVAEKDLSEVIRRAITSLIGREKVPFETILSSIAHDLFTTIEQSFRRALEETDQELSHEKTIELACSKVGIPISDFQTAFQKIRIRYGTTALEKPLHDISEIFLNTIKKQIFNKGLFTFDSFSQHPLLRLWENCIAGMSTTNELSHQHNLTKMIATSISEKIGTIHPEALPLLLQSIAKSIKERTCYFFTARRCDSSTKKEGRTLWYKTNKQDDQALYCIESPEDFTDLLKKIVEDSIENLENTPVSQQTEPQKEVAAILKSLQPNIPEFTSTIVQKYRNDNNSPPWSLHEKGGNSLDVFKIYWEQEIEITTQDLPKKTLFEPLDDTLETVSSLAKQIRDQTGPINPDLRIPASTEQWHAYNFLPSHPSLIRYESLGINSQERKKKLIEESQKFYSFPLTEELQANFANRLAYLIDNTWARARDLSEQQLIDIQNAIEIQPEESKLLLEGKTIGFLIEKRINEAPGKWKTFLELLQKTTEYSKKIAFATKKSEGEEKQSECAKLLLLSLSETTLWYVAQNSAKTGWNEFAHTLCIRYADTNYFSVKTPHTNIHYAFTISPCDNSILFLKLNEENRDIYLETRRHEVIALLPKETLATFDITHKVIAEQSNKFKKKLHRIEKDFAKKLDEYKELAKTTGATTHSLEQFEQIVMTAATLPESQEVNEDYYNAVQRHIDAQLEKIGAAYATLKIELQGKDPQLFLDNQERDLITYLETKDVPQELIKTAKDDFTNLKKILETAPNAQPVLALALASVERYKVECSYIDKKNELFTLAKEFQEQTKEMVTDTPKDIQGPLTIIKYLESEDGLGPEKPVEELTHSLDAMDPQISTRITLIRAYTRRIEKTVKESARLLKKASKEPSRKKQLQQEFTALESSIKQPMKTLPLLREQFRQTQALLVKVKEYS